MIRIRDGTPVHGRASLCSTCRCAQVTQGTKLDERFVLCYNRGTEPLRVTMHVTECSDYEDKTIPSLWEMQKIAWRVSADKRTGKIGFLTPKQFKEKHPDEDD